MTAIKGVPGPTRNPGPAQSYVPADWRARNAAAFGIHERASSPPLPQAPEDAPGVREVLANHHARLSALEGQTHTHEPPDESPDTTEE